MSETGRSAVPVGRCLAGTNGKRSAFFAIDAECNHGFASATGVLAPRHPSARRERGKTEEPHTARRSRDNDGPNSLEEGIRHLPGWRAWRRPRDGSADRFALPRQSPTRSKGFASASARAPYLVSLGLVQHHSSAVVT